jgi:hypothetical protein
VRARGRLRADPRVKLRVCHCYARRRPAWLADRGDLTGVADSERWYQPGEVRPRDLAITPRCPDCKTGPMFHPSHPWGPCWVRMPGGDECGCTVGLRRQE